MVGLLCGFRCLVLVSDTRFKQLEQYEREKRYEELKAQLEALKSGKNDQMRECKMPLVGGEVACGADKKKSKGWTSWVKGVFS